MSNSHCWKAALSIVDNMHDVKRQMRFLAMLVLVGELFHNFGPNRNVSLTFWRDCLEILYRQDTMCGGGENSVFRQRVKHIFTWHHSCELDCWTEQSNSGNVSTLAVSWLAMDAPVVSHGSVSLCVFMFSLASNWFQNSTETPAFLSSPSSLFPFTSPLYIHEADSKPGILLFRLTSCPVWTHSLVKLSTYSSG